MDYRRKKIRIGDLLIQAGAITEEQLSDALEKQRGTGKKLGEFLVEQGVITDDRLAQALSAQLGYELVDLQAIQIDQNVTKLIKGSDMLKKNKCFPFAIDELTGAIKLAMVDPLDINAMDDISIITNFNVDACVATERSVMLAIDRYFGQGDVADALDAYAKEKNLGEQDDSEAQDEISNSPIVVMVKDMIDNAVRQRASDIHVEPLVNRIRVRYRIDGALYERGSYNINVLSAIIARIKIIGGMDISEKRKPQDGRITQIVDRVEYDIRVSVLPTVWGEKVVMRLTAKMALTREKSQLGLQPHEMKQFDYILSHPNGILLVTGPTGSGKSTSLASLIDYVNEKYPYHIITFEDPVEYLHHHKIHQFRH